MAENRAARSMTASRKEEELLDMEVKTKVVVAWMEGLLAEKLPNQPLRDVLHDGVVLCKLANVMKPGCIRKFHRRPKMLMMKMENIAFFLNVAKTRFNVQPTVLFSPTDVHDESSPTSLLKVLRVLLLLRNECPGNAVIDEDLLKALASSTLEDEAEPEPEPEPTPEPTPEPEPEPEPTPGDDEDAEMLEAERMAQEAAEAAKKALEAAKAAQEKAKLAAQERAAAAAAEKERIAAEKAAAEKAAAEAAAAKAAAEKAAAEKAAADKAAADKAAADKAASEAAAAKLAADKAAADAKAAQEKLAAEKLAAQKRATSTPAATSAPTNGKAGGSSGSAGQEEILAEVIKCIHSELSVESKGELRSALQSHLEPIQQKLMYSSDKELRVLCGEMGLADVPEGKERKWYVDWILYQGRSSS